MLGDVIRAGVAEQPTYEADYMFDESADFWTRLPLPYEKPPAALWGNSRKHWRQRSADTRMVREDVLNLARQAGLHRLDRTPAHVTVVLIWAPGDHRRRDEDNLFPLLKAACDSIARGPRRDWVGMEIVPDDTGKYMKKIPRIVSPPAKGMWLDLSIRFEAAS